MCKHKVEIENFEELGADKMDQDLKEKIIKYVSDIKEEVYIDYRDLENIENLILDYNTQEDFLLALDEIYCESYDYIFDYWIKKVIEYFNLDENDYDLFVEVQDIVREHLLIGLPYDTFLDYEVKANVICDFYGEGNSDFTDNGWLRWIMNSQGYKLKNYPAIKKYARWRYLQPTKGGIYYDDNKVKDNEVEQIKKFDSKFLKSVLLEVQEQYIDYMRSLTFLTKMTIREYYAWKECRLKKIVFKKGVECGLFNCWQGCGSILGIDLEKDVTVNAKNIYRIQIEGKKTKGQGYTVDEVYGLVGSCWKKNKFYIKEA